VAGAHVAAKVLVLALSFFLLGQPHGYLRHLSLDWDGIHYLNIARQGYVMDEIPNLGNPFAFPPLFPLLVHLAGAGDMAPFIVNNVAGVLAVAAVTLLMGWRGGLFLGLYPLWLGYSSTGYSEGVFVLLSAAAFLLLRRERPVANGLLGGLVAGLAVAARYLGGVAFALPVLASLGRRRWAMGAFAGLAFVGLGLFAWMTLASGSPFTYFAAQKAWGASLAFPWMQADWYLHGWFTNQDAVRRSVHPSFFLLRGYAFLLLSGYGTFLLLADPKRRDLGLFSLGVVAVVACTIGTPAISTPRLLLGGFPALAVLGDRIRSPAGWAAYAVLAVLGGCWAVTQHLTSFFS
jgi:hypothetical protein